MKWCASLVFLVLGLVCVSRGDDGGEVLTTPTDPSLQTDPGNVSETPPTTAVSAPTESVTDSADEPTPPTAPSTPPVENATVTEEPDVNDNVTNTPTNQTGGEGSSGTTPQETAPGGAVSHSAPDQSHDNASWGYVLLVLIMVVVVALCVILFFLRKVSRTYSFDLQRPSPAHNLSEPIGTFEPVYLDDLDRPALTDQVTGVEPSTPPTANGTRFQNEDNSSDSDVPPESPHVNGLQGAPTSDTDPSDNRTSDQLDGPDLFLDTAKEEQQNENNNNPVSCSGLPFVEINLEEAPWCDQLFSSP